MTSVHFQGERLQPIAEEEDASDEEGAREGWPGRPLSPYLPPPDGSGQGLVAPKVEDDDVSYSRYPPRIRLGVRKR